MASNEGTDLGHGVYGHNEDLGARVELEKHWIWLSRESNQCHMVQVDMRTREGRGGDGGKRGRERVNEGKYILRGEMSYRSFGSLARY